MLSGNPRGPKMKRRRDDDDWGDDDDWSDLSQAQLNDIDSLVASQVQPSQVNNNVVKNDMTTPHSRYSRNTHGFAKPNAPTRPSNSTKLSANWQKQVSELQEQNKALKTTNDSLKAATFSNQGQVKLLRQSLQQKEMEINKLKNEKIHQIEEEHKAKAEQDAMQRKEIEKLKVQLQFKEQELQEIHHSMKRMERRGNNTDENTHINNTQRSPILQSPTRQRNILKSPKTPNSKTFPTKSTFLSNEASPQKKHNTKDASTQGSSSTLPAPERKGALGRRRRMMLNATINAGCTSGPHLVEKLMTTEESRPKSRMDSHSADGLLTILSNQTEFCNRRSHETKDALGIPKSDKNEGPSIIHTDPEKINMAKQGIEALLKSPLVDTKLKTKIQELSSADSVVLLLPLIEDHINTYLEAPHNHPTPEKTDVSSVESSVSAMSSSPNSGTTLLSADKCHSVLSLLLTLVTYSKEVCLAIINGASGSSTSDMETNQPAHGLATNRSGSALSSDSRSATPLPANCKAQIISQCRIFGKLVSLSDPYHVADKVWPCDVMEASISVLSVIAQQCPKSKLSVFLPLLPCDSSGGSSGCAVVHCLDHAHSHPGIVLHVVELLTALVRSQRVVKVFSDNKEDICVLSKLYDAVLQLPSTFYTPRRLTLKYKLVIFLSAILEEKSNLDKILNSQCICGGEIVQTIISVLHQELPLIQSKDKDVVNTATTLLHAGMRLLHSLSVKEELFRRYAFKVEKYAQLMYAYEDISGVQHSEDEVLGHLVTDLWIFEEDDSEEPMDE